MTTELAITPEQTGFNDKQLAALRALGVQNAPPADVALLFHQAARTGLDPFARQIYLIGRGGKYNIQTGIDGFRVIRDRSGTYRGHTEEWCGPDGKWKDVWLDPKAPAAAKVSVHVAGYDVPIVGIARWQEYAQESSPTWKKMPALMLAKCAEALALRKAYPQDLSGLYADDEMPEAERDQDGVYVTTTMRNTALVPKKQAPAKPPVRDKSEVFSEWADRIADTNDVDSLIRLHAEAADRGVLDHENMRGRTIENVFLHRRQEILDAQAQAVAEEPTPAEYDDETPF
jgi:phage recombination protein Bet